MRYANATKTYLIIAVLLGFTTAGLVVAQAGLLATIISSAFKKHQTLADLRTPIVALVVVIAARAITTWYAEVIAGRCSARAKSQLRTALVERIAALGPYELARKNSGALITLISQGIDALDGYFSRYLSQLVLAVIVPVVILTVIVSQDWPSALIIVATLPLIPLFMVLIGLTTRAHTDRQLQTLQRLSGHFLDVVAGLPTLKIFGRSKAQIEAIKTTTEAYRVATMKTLRVAFLSSLVLELLASVSVALVAVSIGLRLLNGHIELQAALFVLILAPEAYLPLRMVGTSFHASADGVAAAGQIFEILEEPLPPHGTNPNIPDLTQSTITIESIGVSYPEQAEPVLEDFNLTIEPGEVLAITGRSGCGKSTLLAVLQGNILPQTGRTLIGSTDLADLDIASWRQHIAVVPQRPHLFAMSIADNVRLGNASATDEQVLDALNNAGLTRRVYDLPDGINTRLGEGGLGLSAGERQRVALARAFLLDAPLLLLDEPTAALDGFKETEIINTIRELAKNRTVVLVTHRSALLGIATRVIQMDKATVSL